MLTPRSIPRHAIRIQFVISTLLGMPPRRTSASSPASSHLRDESSGNHLHDAGSPQTHASHARTHGTEGRHAACFATWIRITGEAHPEPASECSGDHPASATALSGARRLCLFCGSCTVTGAFPSLWPSPHAPLDDHDDHLERDFATVNDADAFERLRQNGQNGAKVAKKRMALRRWRRSNVRGRGRGGGLAKSKFIANGTKPNVSVNTRGLSARRLSSKSAARAAIDRGHALVLAVECHRGVADDGPKRVYEGDGSLVRGPTLDGILKHTRLERQDLSDGSDGWRPLKKMFCSAGNTLVTRSLASASRAWQTCGATCLARRRSFRAVNRRPKNSAHRVADMLERESGSGSLMSSRTKVERSENELQTRASNGNSRFKSLDLIFKENSGRVIRFPKNSKLDVMIVGDAHKCSVACLERFCVTDQLEKLWLWDYKVDVHGYVEFIEKGRLDLGERPKPGAKSNRNREHSKGQDGKGDWLTKVALAFLETNSFATRDVAGVRLIHLRTNPEGTSPEFPPPKCPDFSAPGMVSALLLPTFPNPKYDVHIIAYTSLFRIVNKFHQEVFSDPTVPNRLNRSIDFRAVTLEHDRLLTNCRQEWARHFERDSDQLRYVAPVVSAISDSSASLPDLLTLQTPACEFRVKLSSSFTPITRGSSCLLRVPNVFQRGLEADDEVVFTRSLESAKTVVTVLVDSLVPTGHIHFAPDGCFVFAAFTSAFILKLLRPECVITPGLETEVYQVIECLIATIGSPKIAIDERHTPKLYSRFLASLLAKHKRDGTAQGRMPQQGPPPQQIQTGSSTQMYQQPPQPPQPQPPQQQQQRQQQQPAPPPQNTTSSSLSSGVSGNAGAPDSHHSTEGRGNYVLEQPPDLTFGVTGQPGELMDFTFDTITTPGNDDLLATMQAIQNPTWWQNMMMPRFLIQDHTNTIGMT
ncbi:hypothetical protein F5148DRAFT_1370318 [Russula earlei]|uniref:Uncharacterized protein n=1 Tax=Russula earlei TaxID=71964 RepID=A0ACC0TZW3_9AGAM|nr:hypothetical protein F5148DRAFT_1370318 [Russula earlei]